MWYRPRVPTYRLESKCGRLRGPLYTPIVHGSKPATLAGIAGRLEATLRSLTYLTNTTPGRWLSSPGPTLKPDEGQLGSMTTNPLGDNEELSAVFFNALSNARDGELVVSGCEPTAGAGTWEVDVSAGVIQVGGDEVTVSADSVNHDAADASQNRVDLITADSLGNLSFTKGTLAADPAAPDIPADEVLIAVCRFAAGDSSLASGDILDYRVFGDGLHTLTTSAAPQFKVNGGSATQSADVYEGDDVELVVPVSPIYGDGSDGNITRASSGSEGRLITAENYTINGGVTRTANPGTVIMARQKITINGTLSVDGSGANGGEGGAGFTRSTNDGRDFVSGNNGSPGSDADYSFSNRGENGGNISAQSDVTNPGPGGGGYGARADGSTDGTAGGRAGDGYESTHVDRARSPLGEVVRAAMDNLDGSADIGGAGGGGGGGGGLDDDTGTAGAGGPGGNGGGYIVLMAPVIEVNGTLTADGEDGEDGQDSGTAGSGTGGGGGGGGGLIAVFAERLEDSGTYTAAGGNGGAPGVEGAGGFGSIGQAGADGRDGTIIKVGS